MRSVKKLLKKAMVFTLTAAMLVGTPLTASAAPLNSVYKVTDHWGEKQDKGDDNSHTGTVTNTATTTNSGVLKDNETKILGIALDKKHLDVEVGGKRETLTATVITDLAPGESLVNKYGENATEEMMSQLKRMINWQVLNHDGKIDATTNKKLSIDVVTKGDAAQIVLNPRQGTKDGEDMIVKASLNGTYYFTQDGIEKELADDRKTEGYSAEATVSIKQYSDSLYWSDNGKESKTYLKHTLDLGDMIRRNPETANDTITWTSTNTKVATVSATGVVTAKKVNWTGEAYTQTRGVDDKCEIIAVGEKKGAMIRREIKVEQGTAASEVRIFDRSDFVNPLKNYTQDLGKSRDAKEILIQTFAKAEVAVDASGRLLMAYPTDEGAKPSWVDASVAAGTKKNVTVGGGEWYVTRDANGEYVAKQMVVTDTVTLSSNKPAIASAELSHWNPEGAGAALVTSSSVGKATITVKTTSGRSARLAVDVTANLQKLEIKGIKSGVTKYSGQSITLEAGMTPVESKDAVKWSIAKVTNKANGREIANPNARITNKGVLTIQNKLNPEYLEVTIQLEATKAKDTAGNPIKADPVTIKIAQSSVNGIYVKEQGNDGIVSSIAFNGTKKTTQTSNQNISVPLNKTYVASVDAGFTGAEVAPSAEELAETLQWAATGKDKIVKIDGTGKNVKIKAVGAGTATVTVSGVRALEGKGAKAGTVASASVIKATFKVVVKQPVESITLNKPSVVLAYQTQGRGDNVTTKPQKVALKATLGPKGVGRKETVSWRVLKNGVVPTDETEEIPTTGGRNPKPVTTANVSVNLMKPEIGDVYTITATAESGVSTTSTISIVNKTQAVQIASESTLVDGKPVPFTETVGRSTKTNVKNIGIGKDFKIFTFVNIGNSTKAADAVWKAAGDSDLENSDKYAAESVTYSVNKQGIVSIRNGEVVGIGKGTVTITATTPMNKKATLKVTVQ